MVQSMDSPAGPNREATTIPASASLRPSSFRRRSVRSNPATHGISAGQIDRLFQWHDGKESICQLRRGSLENGLGSTGRILPAIWIALNPAKTPIYPLDNWVALRLLDSPVGRWVKPPTRAVSLVDMAADKRS